MNHEEYKLENEQRISAKLRGINRKADTTVKKIMALHGKLGKLHVERDKVKKALGVCLNERGYEYGEL